MTTSRALAATAWQRTFGTAERRFWSALCLATLLFGAVYVGQRWSPSSYAIVMLSLETSDTGLVWGTPRPERGDEFAWQTPLLQMTVRSGFERFDRTPPFFEDLRTLYGMPIKDWALIFKPQFWMFFIAPAAASYSFYQFLLIASFVVGFTVLFVHLGCRRIDSLLMALVLFFSSFTQYWWNGSSNFIFPFFPWIVMAPLWNWPFAWRLVLFFWIFTVGQLTYFYPPNTLALGFVAVIIWAGMRPDILRWRTAIPLGLTAALSTALVVFYLWEPIVTLSQTVYPGSRVSNGGGIPWQIGLTQFLPTSQINNHTSLLGMNICEASTIGSIYALVAVFFVPWRTLLRESTAQQRWQWSWLALGLLATQTWMMVSLPSWVGYPLLWHRVPPGRMMLGGGLLLMTFAFLLTQAKPLRLTLARAIGFAAVVAGAWYVFKRPHGLDVMTSYLDWVYLIPLAVVVLLSMFSLLSAARANTALLASAAALGILAFGTYNPIQSSRAMFRRPDTAPLVARLDAMMKANPHALVVMPWGTTFFAHSGLPLVGLGYPSITYSTFDPALDLWRKIYPHVPEAQFRLLFNNVGGIAFGDVPEPQRIPGTLVTLAPVAPFTRPGATVCDFIRPSRIALASTVGCPATPAPAP